MIVIDVSRKGKDLISEEVMMICDRDLRNTSALLYHP
jgi:hypothetical protein